MRTPETGFTQNFTLFDETLRYTIRFQNTGNDTAFNITIRDQLPPELDLATFEPGVASHAYEATLHEDGLAEFHFRNILLPDSTTNEPGSHGFVSFRIRTNSGLAENTVVGNSAGIYFDFNAPVLTDTIESVMVSAFPTPVASFTWAAAGLNFNFTDGSLNAPASWHWDFGDGTTSTEQNPAHVFPGAGNFQVCLIAVNSLGADTFCQQIQIILPPTAAFNFSTNGLTATFTDLSSNNPTEWLWDFGDGQSSTLQNPAHTYANGGGWQVCLTVSNPAGSGTTCKFIFAFLVPQAAFSFTINELEVNFTDNSSNDPSTWHWNFGDGASSSEQNPTHVFAQTGNYEVCLTAANQAGEDVFCDTVQVISTGSGEVFGSGGISILPNPVSEWLTVVFENLPRQGTSVCLRNSLGQVVGAPTEVFGRYNSLDVSGLPDGMYLLEVLENGKVTATARFVAAK